MKMNIGWLLTGLLLGLLLGFALQPQTPDHYHNLRITDFWSDSAWCAVTWEDATGTTLYGLRTANGEIIVCSDNVNPFQFK